MDLWIVGVLYITGLGLLLVETVMPGVTLGVFGLGALAVSVVFGFRHHWMIGAAQIGVAVVVAPLCFMVAIRRLTLKASVEGGSFEADYDGLLGREGQAHTNLRPAGIVVIDGKKLDVVTSGEQIEKGSRVRVSKVEGNRVIVRSV
jgi:membrane-bound serine protease (ClpP class)